MFQINITKQKLLLDMNGAHGFDEKYGITEFILFDTDAEIKLCRSNSFLYPLPRFVLILLSNNHCNMPEQNIPPNRIINSERIHELLWKIRPFYGISSAISSYDISHRLFFSLSPGWAMVFIFYLRSACFWSSYFSKTNAIILHTNII